MCEVTKLSHTIRDAYKEVVVNVDYDPFTGTVESVNQILFADYTPNEKTGMPRNVVAVLPVDSVTGLMAKGINWWEVYRREMEAREQEMQLRTEINEQAEQEALLYEHYDQQRKAMNMRLHEEREGRNVTIYDRFVIDGQI